MQYGLVMVDGHDTCPIPIPGFLCQLLHTYVFPGLACFNKAEYVCRFRLDVLHLTHANENTPLKYTIHSVLSIHCTSTSLNYHGLWINGFQIRWVPNDKAPNQSKSIKMNQNLLKSIKIHQNPPKPTKIHQNLSKCNQTYQNASKSNKSIKIHQNPSESLKIY